MVALHVGVLALQGAFARHVEALGDLGVEASEVRTSAQLEQVDRLIIPGGESTTISKLLDGSGLRRPVAEALAGGMPVFGTCAGMIMLAAEVIEPRAGQWSFDAIDVAVRRNGYGRQLASFEAAVTVDALGGSPFPGIFIRAPTVERVGEDCEVLAELDGMPVLCRRGPVLVSSFHPELSPDRRLHEYFCSMR